MRAMILAAGHGKRMRPLTDKIPKPLLEIANKPLIVYQLEALVAAGIHDVVINLGHLGKQIQERLGDGQDFSVNIHYSDEGDSPLETAGGIIKALPYLGKTAFIVSNADIFTDFDYTCLTKKFVDKAHLVLVDNPPHNLHGDFALDDGKLANQGNNRLTYSGIALFHPDFFQGFNAGSLALTPLLRKSVQKQGVSAQYFTGFWRDIGTPERLNSANRIYRKSK